MFQVLGLAFDHCQASGLASPFDVFNVVNTLWQQGGEGAGPYQCHLASASGAAVTASNGTRMLVDYRLEDTPAADLIIVPGIHHGDIDTLIRRLRALDRECQWLRQQHLQGALIAANCSGVFLLAETGALAQQQATTAWWLAGLFQERYPEVHFRADQLLIENRSSYCTGSMTANLGVMLQIVERQAGRQLAQSCARTMLIDATQSYASPYLFLQEQSTHQDALVLAVESWIQRHLSRPLDIEALASAHAVSVRTLSRRFKNANGISLGDYLQKLRLEYCCQLLETTSLSVEQLVERVGYSSQSSLRRLFRKQLGMSPRQYRQRHRRLSAAGAAVTGGSSSAESQGVP